MTAERLLPQVVNSDERTQVKNAPKASFVLRFRGGNGVEQAVSARLSFTKLKCLRLKRRVMIHCRWKHWFEAKAILLVASIFLILFCCSCSSWSPS